MLKWVQSTKTLAVQYLSETVSLSWGFSKGGKKDKQLEEVVFSLSYLPAGRREAASSREYSLVSPRQAKGTAACCSWRREKGVWSEGRTLAPGGSQSPPAPTGSPLGAQRPGRCPTAPGQFGRLRGKYKVSCLKNQ